MEQKNSENQTNRRFVILKRVAKHGRQSVIVVPAMLKDKLKPGTLLQLTMDVLESGEEKDD
jgi:hypothetical protein